SPQSSQSFDRGTHHPGLRLSRTGHPQQTSVSDGWTQGDQVQKRPGHPTATVRVVALNLPGTCQELLELQHGVIARWQMAQAGWSVRIVDPQLHSGRWQPLYRGVYATFTGRPSRTAFLWAAVLRAGPGAALSFDTAAELDRLTDKPNRSIHVTVCPLFQIRLSSRGYHSSSPNFIVPRILHLSP